MIQCAWHVVAKAISLGAPLILVFVSPCKSKQAKHQAIVKAGEKSDSTSALLYQELAYGAATFRLLEPDRQSSLSSSRCRKEHEEHAARCPMFNLEQSESRLKTFELWPTHLFKASAKEVSEVSY